MTNFSDVFEGKTVLITGHSGFKGSWLSIWLNSLGANVIGVSNMKYGPKTIYGASNIGDKIDEYFFDVSDLAGLKNIVELKRPDFIFHLAAQALVRESYLNPIETFKTNSYGSINILESIKDFDKKCIVVMITSDKSYDNLEWVWGYRESDRLGGKDPYSASKGMAEIAIRSYFESFLKINDNLRLGIARAGNVIGGGDWAKDRIVPDCIKAWSKRKPIRIRSPHATRPWQFVLEPLGGYLTLALNLYESSDLNGEAFNFGPSDLNQYTVSALIEKMTEYWPESRWIDDSDKSDVMHEAGLLKLNCDKALYHLTWEARYNFENTVQETMEWYKALYESDRNFMYEFSLDQIIKYTNSK